MGVCYDSRHSFSSFVMCVCQSTVAVQLPPCGQESCKWRATSPKQDRSKPARSSVDTSDGCIDCLRYTFDWLINNGSNGPTVHRRSQESANGEATSPEQDRSKPTQSSADTSDGCIDCLPYTFDWLINNGSNGPTVHRPAKGAQFSFDAHVGCSS